VWCASQATPTPTPTITCSNPINLQIAACEKWARVLYKAYLFHKVEQKVKLSLRLHYAMKTYSGGGIAPPFLTSALDGGEWSASRPGRFTPGKQSPPPYLLGRRLSGPQGRFARWGEKNLQLPGIDPGPSLYQLPICSILIKNILHNYIIFITLRWSSWK
jgi:hypothetical protein